MKRSIAAAIAPLLLVLGACSSDDGSAAADEASIADQATQAPAEDLDNATEMTEDGAGAADAAAGAGAITLAIGTQTWEFDYALCAYANAPAGEPGSEWNVSSTAGDNQVYVSQDSYGPRVSIADVVDYGSMEWVSEGDAVTLEVAGNDISAEGTFTDVNGAQQDGTLTATCPSWVEG